MPKWVVKVLLAAVLLVAMATPALAQYQYGDIPIFVNGQYLLRDSAASTCDDTTLVPLRAVSEALGAQVDWDGELVTMDLLENRIVLRLGDKLALVNGQPVEMALPPMVNKWWNDGRILVPLRFVSEQLGAQVDYADHEIRITTPDGAAPELPDVYRECVERGQYIYLLDDAGARRFDKMTGEQQIVDGADGLRAMLWLGDEYSLAYDASAGKLQNLTLQTAGGEKLLVEEAYRVQVYRGWLYYMTAPRYNCEIRRVRLDGSGKPELVATDVGDYFFVGQRLFLSSWGQKLLVANLDGSGLTRLTDGDYYLLGYDAGRAYLRLDAHTVISQDCEVSPAYGGVVEFPEDELKLQKIRVLGCKMYFNVVTEVQADGVLSAEPGGLYEIYVPALKPDRKLLVDESVLDFYVFSDKIVYKTLNNGATEWKMVNRES